MTNKPDALPVVAWLHTMHMELGQTDVFASKFKDEPFGIAGVDYSATYKVTSEPLVLQTKADADLNELRQSIEGTTGYKYRAELYDEVWQKARDMGYGNVTMALDALAAFKANRDTLQAELAAMREQKPVQADCVGVMRDDLERGLSVDWLLEGGTAELMEGMYLFCLDGGALQFEEGSGQLYVAPVSAPSQVAAEVVQATDDMLYRGVMALNENCAAAVDGLSVDLRESCEREALAVYLAMHRASDIGPVFTAFCNYVDALNEQSAPPVNRLIDALDEYFHADSALLATSQGKRDDYPRELSERRGGPLHAGYSR